MEDREQGAGFAPRTRIAALLGLSVAMLALGLAGCPGVQVSPNADSAPAGSAQTTPAAPAAVPAPAPSMGSATLSWQAPTQNADGTPIAGLAGYRIHYGPSSTQLNQLIEVSGAGSTSYVVTGLTSGTYYFAVSAYNSFGVEGALSNIASKSF
jgi:hypothetical protein